MKEALSYDEKDVHNGWLNGDMHILGDDITIENIYKENLIMSSLLKNMPVINVLFTRHKLLKRLFLLLLSVLLAFSLTACSAAKTPGKRVVDSSVTEKTSSTLPNSESSTKNDQSKENGVGEGEKLINAKIVVGNKVFTAKLYNKETTQALISKLPMTINMAELNGKEKYYHLPENLPTQLTEMPATIHAGEIMCWSSNSLVLFYNTYSNSYGGYVKLGYIEDISGLKEALGKENVQVTFEVSNDQR